MAKDNNTGLMVLVGAGAVVGLALIMSKKAGAGTNLGVKPLPPKPVVDIDADSDEAPVPRMLEQVEPPQASQMPDRYVPITSMPPEVPASADVPPDRYVPITSMPPELPPLSKPNETWSVTSDDGSPVSANPTLAKAKAQSIADHVRSKGGKYDRPRVAVWQALAGLPGVDGLYGPATQAALLRLGAKNVPKALFKGGK